jgi:hypothetical protein
MIETKIKFNLNVYADIPKIITRSTEILKCQQSEKK